MSLDSKLSVQHLDAARMFAAAGFQFPAYTLSTCGWLKPEIISDERVRLFWQRLLEKGTPNDEDLVTEVAIDAALESGIYRDVMQWKQYLPEAPMPQSYAAEIVRLNWIRSAGRTAAELVQAIAGQDYDGVKAAIEKLQSTSDGAPSNAATASDMHAALMHALDQPNQNILTYIPPLDKALAGVHRKNLTLVAGRPGMGKTALLLQILKNAALSSRKVLLFEIEMPKEQIWTRLAAPLVGLSQRDIDHGLSAEQRRKLEASSEELSIQLADNFLIDDTPRLTIDQVWERTLRVSPDIVALDHLSLLADEDKRGSEVRRLDQLSARMKQLAKAANCAFLLAVQLNRNLEGRPDKRPMLSDLRDSGGIEQNADVALMMHREDYYSNTGIPPERSRTELWVRKNRHGNPNILINLDYILKQQWFDEPEPTPAQKYTAANRR